MALNQNLDIEIRLKSMTRIYINGINEKASLLKRAVF